MLFSWTRLLLRHRSSLATCCALQLTSVVMRDEMDTLISSQIGLNHFVKYLLSKQDPESVPVMNGDLSTITILAPLQISTLDQVQIVPTEEIPASPRKSSRPTTPRGRTTDEEDRSKPRTPRSHEDHSKSGTPRSHEDHSKPGTPRSHDHHSKRHSMKSHDEHKHHSPRSHDNHPAPTRSTSVQGLQIPKVEILAKHPDGTQSARVPIWAQTPAHVSSDEGSRSGNSSPRSASSDSIGKAGRASSRGDRLDRSPRKVFFASFFPALCFHSVQNWLILKIGITNKPYRLSQVSSEKAIPI